METRAQSTMLLFETRFLDDLSSRFISYEGEWTSGPDILSFGCKELSRARADILDGRVEESVGLAV
jgi:hypothetical protein